MGTNAFSAKEVFDCAHEIVSMAERQAYLDQACSGSPNLRQRVEGLLRAYEEAGSFLEGSAVTAEATGPYQSPETGPYQPGGPPLEQTTDEDPHKTIAPPPPRESPSRIEGPGTHIGPYQLIEEIGHGGMGAVYLASQEQPVRRQVALKIIKPGMDSAQIVARFEAERQALAMMDHLNIAKVLDAGATATGRPFFVMELVKGVPMTRFCDDNKLTLRERLELFVPVCQAIQHAHQKGIIHRDIKPSNVLVTVQDGKPVPKVIDFGIAKALHERLTEHSMHTEVGAIIGTLEYMSPEQADFSAEGVDTRSDVYSLGVLLYELLTSTTPIERARVRKVGFAGVLLLIKEEEPPRPSTRLSDLGQELAAIAAHQKTEPAKLAKLLRGELDWIILKALEKDRTRRYETVSALAQDVQRYLADEPVEACPPSTRYRLGKFARKHRTLLAAVGSLVAVLLLGVVGLTTGIFAVQRARLNTEYALKKEIEAQKHTRAALDTTDSVIRALIRNKTSLGFLEKATLRNVLKGYKQLVPESVDTQVARATAAETHFRVAGFQVLVGDSTDAETSYSQAIRLYENLAEDFPEKTEYRKELARCNFDLGILLTDLKEYPRAEVAYRRAIELQVQLAELSKGVSSNDRDLADFLDNLGVCLRETSKLPEAEKVYHQAIELGEKQVKAFPGVPDFEIDLAATYVNLGNTVRDQSQAEASLTWYGKAIELLNPIAAQKEPVANERLFLRNAFWDRANALAQLNRHAEAAKDWLRAIELDDGKDKESLLLFLAATQEEQKLKAALKGKSASDSASLYYGSALVFARAAGARAVADEPSLKKQYTSRTMELLTQAKTAGYFQDPRRIEKFKKDPTFDSLGQQEDFQKFIKDLKPK